MLNSQTLRVIPSKPTGSRGGWGAWAHTAIQGPTLLGPVTVPLSGTRVWYQSLVCNEGKTVDRLSGPDVEVVIHFPQPLNTDSRGNWVCGLAVCSGGKGKSLVNTSHLALNSLATITQKT